MDSTLLITLLIYLSVLFIPGYLITRLLKVNNHLYLYSISLSLAYFVTTLSLSIFSGTSIDQYILIFCTGVIVLGVFFITKKLKPYINLNYFYPSLFVIIATCFYFLIVGIYDEVPSDMFRHLEYFKEINNQVQGNTFPNFSLNHIFSKQVKYWYYLPIIVCYASQSTFIELVPVFFISNVALFLVGVFYFSISLFEIKIKSTKKLILIALTSTLFTALHFGNDAFAFIRYYAIAPVILNYLLYLTCVIILVDYFNFRTSFWRFLLLTGLLSVSALALHLQEVMYIGTMYLLILLILFFNKIRYKLTSNPKANQPIRNNILLIFPLAMLLVIGVYYYSITYNSAYSPIYPKIISLNQLFGFANNYYILNPYVQFYTTMTQWGIFVLIAYLIYYKKYFSGHTVLLAGMLVPFVTVFNPWFVDFFLHHANTHVFWRFLYIVPIYFVAARLFVGLLFCVEKTIFGKTLKSITLILLIILLFPIQIASINLPYSRIYSLTKIPEQARPQYWQDLLNYLNSIPSSQAVITDPVTGYMISALTKHNNRRFKFFSGRGYDQYLFDSYDDHPLKKYNANLLIVNLRDGMLTPAAATARHWPVNTLELSRNYSPALLDHITSFPLNFQLIWTTNDIQVYKIKY